MTCPVPVTFRVAVARLNQVTCTGRWCLYQCDHRAVGRRKAAVRILHYSAVSERPMRSL
jgi:hypothetical protein